MTKNNKFCWTTILGFLLVTLSACGGGGGGNSAPSTNALNVIGPTGGSATSADANVVIQVPAGALATSAEITITRKEDTYGQIGNIYQIEQQGGASLSFSNPVIIKVKYDPNLLPSGAKESELMLAVMNPYESLEFLSDSIVDPINHVVTATTTHFSDVILLPKLSVGAPPTLIFPLHNSNGPFDAAITSIFDHSMDPKKPYYADGIVTDYKGEIGNASPDPNFTVTVVTGQKLRGYSNPSIPQFVVNGNYTGGNYLYYDGHPGYDYKTVSTQVPSGQIDVFAAADGIAHIGGPKYGTIWIDHGNGYSTWYLHLSQRLVGDNKSVKKGDRIGVAGNTAPFYVGPHLHFEVKRNNVPIDPYSENLWETLSNPSRPATPTSFTVTPASSSQIDLAWTASTGTVTGYKIYRGGTYLKSVTAASTSDTGLSASTNYCYYVIAYNSAGDSVQTSQFCATTQAPPLSPPSTPTGFILTPASSTQIDLSWTAPTGTVTGYKVYKSGSLLKTIPSTATSTSDTGLSSSTNYCYSIIAYNTAGDSTPSSALCATTQAPPLSPPPTPTSFTVTPASSSQINLAWTASTGTVTGYKIYRGGTYLKSVTVASTSDTGLSSLTNYCYYVTAYNSAGESIQSSQLCATTSANIPANINGAWSGTYTLISAVGGSQSYVLSLNVVQSGTTVTGTWQSTAGSVGTLNGTVNGNTVNTVFSQTNPTCTGSFNTTATVNGNTITVTSGNGSTTCQGAITSISGSMIASSSYQTYVIQPGPTDGKDTFYGTVYLTDGRPNLDSLYIGGWADFYYDFIEFNLNGSPSAGNVLSATLYLYGAAPAGGNDPGLQINRITQSWTEVGVNLTNNPSSVFYKNFGPFAIGDSVWNSVDITDLYKNWKNGTYPNYGIELVPTNNIKSNGGVASSNNLDGTIRPKIVIVYSP